MDSCKAAQAAGNTEPAPWLHNLPAIAGYVLIVFRAEHSCSIFASADTPLIG